MMWTTHCKWLLLSCLLWILLIIPDVQSFPLDSSNRGSMRTGDKAAGRSKRWIQTSGPWGLGADVTGFLWGYVLHQALGAGSALRGLSLRG